MELVDGDTGGLPESSSPDGQTVAYTVAGARPDIQARPTHTSRHGCVHFKGQIGKRQGPRTLRNQGGRAQGPPLHP
jgi:hypothetical protein